MTPGLAQIYAAFREQHALHNCLVNGQRWEYIVAGAGQALLLLPGFFGVAGTDFLYILAFQPHYRVISVTYPETCASAAELVDGLAGLLDELGVAQAHVLGGSYSGYIAQVFVRRYPQRVGKLILAQTGAPRRRHLPLAFTLAGLCRWTPPGLLRWLMRQAVTRFLPQATPQQAFWRAYFLDLIDSFSPRALYHRFRVALDYHRRYRFAPGDLAGWPGAILILEAQGDTLLAPDDNQVLRRLYPQAQRGCVPGDHVQSVDQPEAQIAAILQFLLDGL